MLYLILSLFCFFLAFMFSSILAIEEEKGKRKDDGDV